MMTGPQGIAIGGAAVIVAAMVGLACWLKGGEATCGEVTRFLAISKQTEALNTVTSSIGPCPGGRPRWEGQRVQ